MKNIECTTVASGIIGSYNIEWKIDRLYDRKYDSECYHLYIDRRYIDYYPTVANALVGLLNQFNFDVVS